MLICSSVVEEPNSRPSSECHIFMDLFNIVVLKFSNSFLNLNCGRALKVVQRPEKYSKFSAKAEYLSTGAYTGEDGQSVPFAIGLPAHT